MNQPAGKNVVKFESRETERKRKKNAIDAEREEPFFWGSCITRAEFYGTEKESEGNEKW